MRILIAANFFLFALLISPLGTSRELYRAIHGSVIDRILTYSVPSWFVGSTLLATTLFFAQYFRYRATWDERGEAVDASLLVLWWLVLIGTCTYGFLLGMAG